MRRRIVSEILALAGLVVIVLAVCSATIWKPSSTAVASLPAAPASAYVVTSPGVLGVADPEVTIKATAADASAPVVIAIAHWQDVQAWLGQDPYEAVTDLSSWEQLEVVSVLTSCDAAKVAAGLQEADAQCTELSASGADPAQSDLWLRTEKGTGSATLAINAADPDLVALVATDGTAPAPMVSLSWPRTVSTPWLVPGLILGGLLLLVGVFGFVLDLQLRNQEAQRRNRAAERAARLATADGVSTQALPQVGDPNRALTRREKRDKERAESLGEEWADPRTGKVYLNGVELPTVPVPNVEEMPESVFEPTSQQVREHTGPARGSVVVPGLLDESVKAHRSARQMPEHAPAFEAAPEAAPEPAQAPGPQQPKVAAVPDLPEWSFSASPRSHQPQEDDLVLVPVLPQEPGHGGQDVGATARIPAVKDAAEPGGEADGSTLDVHEVRAAVEADGEQVEGDLPQWHDRHAAKPQAPQPADSHEENA